MTGSLEYKWKQDRILQMATKKSIPTKSWSSTTDRMGDVANILGIEKPAPASREFMETTKTELPPIVPTNTGAPDKKMVKIGNKFISSEKKARPWTWAPFSSSSRTDGLLLHHWVRSNVEYPDYPYARFDIHLDPVVYNDDTEYHEYLHDPDWTKGETDQLLTMAKTYELRWPVIYDRWCTHFDYKIIPKNRNIEDLQARYYTVAAILMQQRVVKEASQEAQNRQNQTNEALEQHSGERANTDALLIESAAAKAMGLSDPKHQPFMKQLGTGSTNKPVFDLNYERARRAHLELLWKRTKEQDDEEDRLRKELKEVETQLRKLKKSGIHVAAAKRQRSATVSTETIKSAFSSPTPMPGTPYLQSARMAPPGTTVNKNLLLQMKEILQEMRIPESPIPSKRVCDLYDSVRRDILSLLVLQKNLLQKEGLLQSKRLVVSKRGGAIKAPDEETLLGIDPKAVARAPDAQTVSVGRPNGPNNKGSKTPRSIASNKSGFAADSRKDIPSVISTTDPDGASKIGASQGKQVKKPGAPKRKRKSADAAKISTTVASATAETSSNSPTQMATETATSKTVGKKRKKTDKATGQS